MKSWKQIREECLSNKLVGVALELVMKSFHSCSWLSYCVKVCNSCSRGLLGYSAIDVSKTQR